MLKFSAKDFLFAPVRLRFYLSQNYHYQVIELF